MVNTVDAVVTMLPTQEEGLASPLSLPCRSLLLGFDQTSGAQLIGVIISGSGVLEPGKTQMVQLAPIYPEFVLSFTAAHTFDLYYGRIVGRGTITG